MAQYKAMLHTSEAIQKEREKIRRKLGLPKKPPQRKKDVNRGKQRQRARGLFRDAGNVLQVLTKEKREWLLKTGKSQCTFHKGKLLSRIYSGRD